jgi:hypothetical protein
MLMNHKILDGYNLNHADGYSAASYWQDVGAFPFISISVVFGSNSVAGTLTLLSSNDGAEQKDPAYGRMIPKTAKDAKSDPVDAQVIAGSSQAVSGNANPYTYVISGASFRWIKLKYVDSSGSVTTTIDAFLHAKAQL